MTLIFMKKPKLIFTSDGQIRSFGVTSSNNENSLEKEDGNKTIYSLGVITVVLAIVCFYILCIIDLIFEE